MTTLSVVIVNTNAREELRACLENLKSALPHSSEVIVVDNASRDGSARMIAEQFLHVRLVRNPQNAGFAVAANRGASMARGAYVLFLAPQMRVLGGAVKRMLAFLEAHLHYGAVGPRVLHPDGETIATVKRLPCAWTPLLVGTPLQEILPANREVRRHLALDFDYGESATVEQISTTCILMRRKALRRERVFDEGLWMFYGESDLCHRLRAAGWRIAYLSDARVVQHRDTGQPRPADNRDVHYHDQLSYFRRNHGRLGATWVKACVALAAVEHCVLELYRRAEGHPERPLLPVLESLSGLLKA